MIKSLLIRNIVNFFNIQYVDLIKHSIFQGQRQVQYLPSQTTVDLKTERSLPVSSIIDMNRPFAVNSSEYFVKNLDWQQIFIVITLNFNKTFYLQKFSTYFPTVF